MFWGGGKRGSGKVGPDPRRGAEASHSTTQPTTSAPARHAAAAGEEEGLQQELAYSKEYWMREVVAQDIYLTLQELVWKVFPEVGDVHARIAQLGEDLLAKSGELAYAVPFDKVKKEIEDLIEFLNSVTAGSELQHWDAVAPTTTPAAASSTPKARTTTAAPTTASKIYSSDAMEALLQIAKDITSALNGGSLPEAEMRLFLIKLSEVQSHYKANINTDAPYQALMNKIRASTCIYNLDARCEAFKTRGNVAARNIEQFQKQMREGIEAMKPRVLTSTPHS